MSDELLHDPGHGEFDEPDAAAPLFGAARLTPDEASRLLARGPGRLVVWAGEQGAGKTTLSVELYERQRRAGTGTRFAGSWTLLAFEQLAHQRRAGGGASPTWQPRPALDLDARELLHLALSAGEDPLHLLFAELSGEEMLRLADNQIPATEIPWLRRADKLALLVDGERVADPANRAMVMTRVRQLIERLRSSALPHPGSGLALLVTKWDRVRDQTGAAEYWAPREAELLADLRSLDPGARAFHVDAVGADPGSDGGFGALRAWLLDMVAPVSEPPTRASPGAGAPSGGSATLAAVAAPAAAGSPLDHPLEAARQQSVRRDPMPDEQLLEVPADGFGWLKEAPPRLRKPWRLRR